MIDTINLTLRCSVGRRDGFMIDYRGDVYVCSSLRTNEFKLGNILEEDIDPVIFLNRWIPPFVDEFDKCKGCPVQYFCVGGGCIARNLGFTGSLTKPSPYCKLYGVLIEAIIYDRLPELRDRDKIIATLEWMKSELRKEREKYATGVEK